MRVSVAQTKRRAYCTSRPVTSQSSCIQCINYTEKKRAIFFGCPASLYCLSLSSKILVLIFSSSSSWSPPSLLLAQHDSFFHLCLWETQEETWTWDENHAWAAFMTKRSTKKNGYSSGSSHLIISSFSSSLSFFLSSLVYLFLLAASLYFSSSFSFRACDHNESDQRVTRCHWKTVWILQFMTHSSCLDSLTIFASCWNLFLVSLDLFLSQVVLELNPRLVFFSLLSFVTASSSSLILLLLLSVPSPPPPLSLFFLSSFIAFSWENNTHCFESYTATSYHTSHQVHVVSHRSTCARKTFLSSKSLWFCRWSDEDSDP